MLEEFVGYILAKISNMHDAANVRFPFIVSSLPDGNGSEVDRIGSRAGNQYEELFRNRTDGSDDLHLEITIRDAIRLSNLPRLIDDKR